MDAKCLVHLSGLALALLTTLSCLIGHGPDQDYPAAEDDLPKREFLPDPFSFYREKRTVEDLEDWKKRRDEMKEMLCHYLIGRPIPHYYEQSKEVKATSEEVPGFKTPIHKTMLQLGPEEVNISYSFEYFFPETDKPFPVIFKIVAGRYSIRNELVMSELIPRGYGFVRLSAGGKIRGAFHPEIERCSLNELAWFVDEAVHFLKRKYPGRIDKVILTGHSRWGKMSVAAGVLSEQIDMVVPVVTGGGGVMTYRNPPVYGQSNKVFQTFAGKYDRIPIDFNFCTALIAPRPYLAIMGDEGAVKAAQIVEGYDAAKVVYRWLGVEERVGLFDHSPRMHEFQVPDLRAIMEFSDMMFYEKKPTAMKVEWFYENTGPRYLKEEDIDSTGNWKVPPPVQVVPGSAAARRWFREAQELTGPVGPDKMVTVEGTFEGTMKKVGVDYYPDLNNGIEALLKFDKKKDEDLRKLAEGLIGKEVLIKATSHTKDGIMVLGDITEIKVK